MSKARNDFFAREAGDYLRELELLVGAAEPPGEPLVRLARALRGAAMLAGPRTFTTAASELERLARQVREGTVAWDEAASHLRRAVDGLGRLAGQAAIWDDGQDREAGALAESLRGVQAPEHAIRATTPGSADGMRAFVARETATVAGATELAAQAMAGAASPPVERLAAVSRAMQTLRGVAGLGEVAPLGDLLDAADTAVLEVGRHPVVPAVAADLFLALAAAFGRIAREVAGAGRPAEAAPEVDRVADLLFAFLAGPDVIVPVEELLDDGAGAVQPYGGRRDGPPPATAMDLASLGERLRHGAGQLRAASSPAAAHLQTAVLLSTLRDAPGALGTRPAGEFVRHLLGHLAERPAGPIEPLADLLERAGSRLAAGSREDLLTLAQDLEALRQELAPVTPGQVVPIEDLLVDEEPVPIESLAPEDEAPAAADRTRLERSLSTYSRLVRTGAPATPLDAVLGASSRPAPPATVPGEEVVPIETLLYRGRAALLRADQVRRELEAALQTAADELDRVEPLVRELLDLVPLALADGR